MQFEFVLVQGAVRFREDSPLPDVIAIVDMTESLGRSFKSK